MSTYDPERRTWWCHVAERLGVVADADESGRESVFHRWARHHVNQCAYCRAEREEWAMIRRRLQTSARTSAPDALLDGVMARIALERTHHQHAPTQPAYAATRAATHTPTTVWLRVARGVMASAGLAAVGLGTVGSVVVGRSAVGSVSPVSLPLSELADAVRGAWLQTFHSINVAASQVGPGGQLFSAVVWGLIGLSVALAVATAAETATNDK